jgi:hypothetical protein
MGPKRQGAVAREPRLFLEGGVGLSRYPNQSSWFAHQKQHAHDQKARSRCAMDPDLWNRARQGLTYRTAMLLVRTSAAAAPRKTARREWPEAARLSVAS